MKRQQEKKATRKQGIVQQKATLKALSSKELVLLRQCTKTHTTIESLFSCKSCVILFTPKLQQTLSVQNSPIVLESEATL